MTLLNGLQRFFRHRHDDLILGVRHELLVALGESREVCYATGLPTGSNIVCSSYGKAWDSPF